MSMHRGKGGEGAAVPKSPGRSAEQAQLMRRALYLEIAATVVIGSARQTLKPSIVLQDMSNTDMVSQPLCIGNSGMDLALQTSRNDSNNQLTGVLPGNREPTCWPTGSCQPHAFIPHYCHGTQIHAFPFIFIGSLEVASSKGEEARTPVTSSARLAAGSVDAYRSE